MPNLVTVHPHNELVGIRPVRKRAKTYYMGSCMIGNVQVGRDCLTGYLLDEWSEIREPLPAVMDHLTEIVYEESFGFGEIVIPNWLDQWGEEVVMFVPLEGMTFKAAWIVGSEFYVSRY